MTTTVTRYDGDLVELRFTEEDGTTAIALTERDMFALVAQILEVAVQILAADTAPASVIA